MKDSVIRLFRVVWEWPHSLKIKHRFGMNSRNSEQVFEKIKISFPSDPVDTLKYGNEQRLSNCPRNGINHGSNRKSAFWEKIKEVWEYGSMGVWE